GRISIVNVNGNTEPKRLRAFELALGTPVPSNAEPSDDPAREPREAAGESTLATMLRRQAPVGHAHEQAPARPEPKGEARVDAHAEPKGEARVDAHAERKAEAHADVAAEPNTEGHGVRVPD